MSDIQIIAYDADTHAVVPREATDAMRKASGDCAGPWDEWRAMISAAPPPPAIGVVKGLEWVEDDDGTFWAQTAICLYSIRKSHVFGFNAAQQVRSSRIPVACTATLDEAKAACQREFNRLVADCLNGTVGGGG